MVDRPQGQKPDRFDLSLYADGIAEFKSKPHKRQPYVLLGHIDINCFADGPGGDYKREWKPFVFPMWAGLLGSCPSDLQNLLNKGCVILDSWIPELKDLPGYTERGGMAMDHGWALEYRSPEGQKRAAELRSMIARAKGELDAVVQVSKRNAELERKLKDMEAKVARSGK